MNLPENLEKLIKLENELVDVPLKDCQIVRVEENLITFKNIVKGVEYFGEYYSSNGKISDWLRIFINRCLKYNGFEINILDKIEVLQFMHQLVDIELVKFIPYDYLLRIYEGKIQGIIGKNYRTTNKAYIFQIIFQKLNSIFDKVSFHEYVWNNGNLAILFKSNGTRIYRIEFGKETGNSALNFENLLTNRNYKWYHNFDYEDLGIKIDNSLEFNNVMVNNY